MAKTTDYYPTKTTVLYLAMQGGQFEPVSGGQLEMADGGQIPLGNGGQFTWIFQKVTFAREIIDVMTETEFQDNEDLGTKIDLLAEEIRSWNK